MTEREMELAYLENDRENEEKQEAYRQYCEEMHHRGELTASIALDRLEAICAAERDGRVVVLPCKVGDTVYAHCFRYVDEGVIESFSINQYRLAARFVATDGEKWSFFKEDFGKTVFLTRAEAEAALRNLDGGGQDG